MINMLRMVDVSNPPNTTIAIGACISLPVLSPAIIIGIRARAEVRAVIMIGVSLSTEPCMIVCFSERPSE